MAAKLLFDLSKINLQTVIFGPDVIRAHNPHRGHMELLHGVVHYDADALEACGFHDTAEDAFWVEGHIPGSPLFPGALMVETAAQLSSFCYRKRFGFEDSKFFGFGGIDKLKFRGVVRPGSRLYVLCTDVVLNRRHSRFNVQGVCDEKIVFDGQIVGVAMPVKAALPGSSGHPEQASAT